MGATGAPSITSVGVLAHQDILELCGLAGNADEQSDRVTGSGPIRPCVRAHVRSASYDLSLGDEYHLRDADGARCGDVKVSRLEPSVNEGVVVPAHGAVIVTAYEQLEMDDQTVGHLSLKLDLLLRGFMMGSQSQIDAGYRGLVWALLYNLSDKPRVLKYRDPFMRLELVRLERATTKPYHDKYQRAQLSRALREPIESGLHQMQQQVDTLAGRFRTATWFASGIALVALIAGFLPLTMSFFGPLDSSVDRLNRRVDAQTQTVRDLRATLRRAERQIKRLREERR